MGGILIIGAGGHGKVVADIILSQRMPLLGFLDDNAAVTGRKVLGFPILGKIENWQDFELDGLIVGVGSNAARRDIVRRVESSFRAPPWKTVIHPKAVIASTVQIQAGTVVMAGAVVNVDAKIGKHTIINTGATVDHDSTVGSFVHVAPGVHIAGSVEIGDLTLLGIGCSVIPGCKIGENTIIGSGATIVHDIPPNVVAKGVPASWD